MYDIKIKVIPTLYPHIKEGIKFRSGGMFDGGNDANAMMIIMKRRVILK